MNERTAELFDRGVPAQKCVARLTLPADFEKPPVIILYGSRAFVLVIRCSQDVFHYIEESTWRAPMVAKPGEIVVGQDVALPVEVAR